MSETATTTLSSKGQVVIPEGIRDRLGLKPGAQFIILADHDVVILKVIQPPSMSDFDAVVARARRAAKQTGLRRSDVQKAVARVRRAK